ncbi:MAG: hypothetical protein Q8K97_00020 [Pseudohongiella sp.]|nr:hypothetical protein [Pseudohongiella sp.]
MTSNSNTLFFGNSLDASCILGDLQEFRNYIDGYLKNESKYFEEEAHVDLEREFLPLFSETFPPILHSSLVITSVIFLETQIRGISQALKEKLNLKLSLRDLSGNLLDQFKKYLIAVADVDSAHEHIPWDDVSSLFEFRNCLVHADGILTNYPKRKVIEQLFNKHGLELGEGELISVDSDASEKALLISSSFIEAVYRCLLNEFPK